MNKNRVLWTLVIADILLAFGSAGAEGFFGWTLPPVLREYRHERFTGFSFVSPVQMLQLLLLAVTVLSAFGAWIGLLSYWRFARGLYVFSLACWLVFTLFHGPSVDTSVAAVFKTLNALASGAILGLVYFSDLARRFEGGAAGVAPTGMNLGAHRA